MVRILVISEYVKVRTWFDVSVADLGGVVRSVATISAGKEWLRTQTFDLLVVDPRFRSLNIIQFFQDAWKIDPLLHGVCVNFDNTISDILPLKVSGIEIIDTNNSYEKIVDLIRRMNAPKDSDNTNRVLIVEDLDSPRFIISMLIYSLKLGTVSCVDNAVSAFETLKQSTGDFYCVVTDLNMPEHSGIELLNWIRMDNRTAHIPVIVLTSNATSNYLFEALKAGASGFLVKPPSKVQLKSELTKAQRIFHNCISPRLCAEEEARLIKNEIEKQMERAQIEK